MLDIHDNQGTTRIWGINVEKSDSGRPIGNFLDHPEVRNAGILNFFQLWILCKIDRHINKGCTDSKNYVLF